MRFGIKYKTYTKAHLYIETFQQNNKITCVFYK